MFILEFIGQFGFGVIVFDLIIFKVILICESIVLYQGLVFLISFYVIVGFECVELEIIIWVNLIYFGGSMG